jgi:hypothetical protein
MTAMPRKSPPNFCVARKKSATAALAHAAASSQQNAIDTRNSLKNRKIVGLQQHNSAKTQHVGA